MLSVFEKGIIELTKCALKGGVPSIEEGFSFEDAYIYGQKRQIVPLLFYGAMGLDGFMDTEVGKKFFKSTMNLSYFCAEQSAAVQSVVDAFKVNKVQHLVLKGTILRDLYPYPEMRLMSDADILIKEKEYTRIKPIMMELGFTESFESDHELAWTKGDVMIELHKRLVPSYNKDFFNYFGDGWKLAKMRDEDTKECYMSLEDNFVYTFVHFAKHYRDSGISVKHLTDFYVIMEKNPEMDFDYIDRELEKLQLLDFWKNIKNAVGAWFGLNEWDEKSEYIAQKIISNKVYGSNENRMQARALKASKKTKHIKLKKVFNLIFPKYSGMCQKYKFLKKVPILLPFMWVFRWFQTLFTPSKIKARKKELDIVSAESINKYQSELEFVGLGFNFE